jgi:hypothetical protein
LGDRRGGIRRVKIWNLEFYSSLAAVDVYDQYNVFRAFGDRKFHDLELVCSLVKTIPWYIH